ncbi:MAG: glycosyltransferase family 4 protein [Planctomycetia bacterium]|nr:glycosyltransferase family 4 protein [Planctomycetia bacterium]
MRIAQVAPLYEAVPPKLYGGTERVVSYLTEELVRQGHDVTLFASGDSVTSARLVPACREALRLDKTCVDTLALHFVMLERVAREARHFDVIHFHVDYLHYPLSRRLGVPHVTTLHGWLNLPELNVLYDEFSDVPVISISNYQRRPLPRANWQATVYHGLPPCPTQNEASGDYLAFLGRISPEKRADRAVEIARRVGMKLRVAAKVDRADVEYYRAEIEPLFRDPLVEFIGEIGEDEKPAFLGNARAVLFPIDWPEPFGLVMIESMRCGTPVIGWRCGSVPEVIDDGVTGFIVDDLDEAVRAVDRLGELDRESIRDVFETRFSAARMAADYVAVYQRLLARSVRSAPRKLALAATSDNGRSNGHSNGQ